MQSRVNPQLTVTKENWVVSLVRRRYHAFIVVESLGYENDPGLGIRWYDFVSKERRPWPKEIYALIKNQTFDGVVRECGYYHDVVDFGNLMSRKDLFKWRRWHDHDLFSWVCPAANARHMLEDIKKDIAFSTDNEMTISLTGKPIGNCTTWALEKLHVAGIDVTPVKNISNYISIQAKGVIGNWFPGFFNRHKCKPQPDFVHRLSPVTEPVQVPYKKNPK